MTLYRVENKRLFYGSNPNPLLTAEVHLHIDGALEKSDVLRINAQQGRRLYFPLRGLDKARIDYQGRSRRIITEEQLQELWYGWGKYTVPLMFGAVTGLMQTKESIVEISKAHVLSQAREGKIYIETRFAPQYHCKKKLKMDQVVGYVLEGLNLGAEEAAKEGLTIIPRLIVCLGREAGKRKGIQVAETALRFQNEGVVALDLACYEPLFEPERHLKAFQMTIDSALFRTVHAGEMCDLDTNLRNISTAIYHLGANGLGHAKDLYRSPELVQAVLERGIRIESNEVSNVALKFSGKVGDAHLDDLVERDVLVIVDSDDPSMWPDGSLAHCLYQAAIAYGDEFVKRIIANPIRGAFGLNDLQKQQMIKKLEDQFT